jgi:DNA-binding CsgD family transcriptional regulator
MTLDRLSDYSSMSAACRDLAPKLNIGVGSIYDLADIYGVHRNTVAHHLKAQEVKLGGRPMSSNEIDRAQELRQQGLSGNAIGRAIGRDPKTVRSALSSADRT